MDKNRFPHFTSADGGMVASEMQERLDAIAPDYHQLNPTTQARLLLEEIAALEAENARLREALEQIHRGVDHPLGIHEAPQFYEGIAWASGIAERALDAEGYIFKG